MRLLQLLTVVAVTTDVTGQNDFPCTKLAEVLPDTALQFAKEYFAWKKPDKINVRILRELTNEVNLF